MQVFEQLFGIILDFHYLCKMNLIQLDNLMIITE